MKYIEITITTTTEAQEVIADKLWEYTSYGVAICDHKDVVELIEKRQNTFDYIEDSLQNEQDSSVLVKAYIDMSSKEEIIPMIERDLQEIKDRSSSFMNVGSLETVKRVVDGDDWIEIWRKHFRPIDLGKIVICPEWIEHTPKKGQKMVKIASNMAFGTGEHETTSMCIEMLSQVVYKGSFVIDVGTGSGILGIASAKLGANRVYMTDIDPVAVTTARHNVELNEVSKVCQVELNDLVGDQSLYGDIVVANITADILEILSRNIYKNIKKGGVLIMSGILKSKQQQVIDCYTSLGFTLKDKQEKGEWVALCMVADYGA